jgi:hypothetical protein
LLPEGRKPRFQLAGADRDQWPEVFPIADRRERYVAVLMTVKAQDRRRCNFAVPLGYYYCVEFLHQTVQDLEILLEGKRGTVQRRL